MIARVLALAALLCLCACEAVPPAYFDTHPDGSPNDDGGDDAGSDAVTDGGGAEACAITDATSACCANGTPCEGQCGNPQACGRCGVCNLDSYCCAKNVGSAACKRFGDPCL